MKKIMVLSVGGSLIVPKEIDHKFLHNLKKTLSKHYKTHKFVIVVGGGSIARKYISALKMEGKSKKELASAGIRATRMNAQFLMQFFGKNANQELPKNMKEVKNSLPKNSVVICGALRYSPDSTSDETAAKLAKYLKTDFINLTNVPGLYTSDPRKNKKASLIPYESHSDFLKRVNKMSFEAGQHFVLDQKAAKIIKENNIETSIIGPNLKNLEKVMAKKKFTGTLISNDRDK